MAELEMDVEVEAAEPFEIDDADLENCGSGLSASSTMWTTCYTCQC